MTPRSALSLVPTPAPTYSELVATEVRAALARRRVPAKRLAAALDLSTASFSRRMNGHAEFTVDEVAFIAGVLRVPIHSLMPANEPVTWEDTLLPHPDSNGKPAGYQSKVTPDVADAS